MGKKRDFVQKLIPLIDIIENTIPDIDDVIQSDDEWQQTFSDAWKPVADGDATEGVLPDGTVLRDRTDTRAAILKHRDELGYELLSIITPIIKSSQDIVRDGFPRGFKNVLTGYLEMISQWDTPEDIRNSWTGKSVNEFVFTKNILLDIVRRIEWAIESTNKSNIRFYLGVN